MQARPVARIFAGALSLLVATAWLFASNHCAIASLIPPATAVAGEHEHCPGSSTPKPAPEKNGCDGQNCCKALSASCLAFAKSPLAFDTFDFAPLKFLAVVAILAAEPHAACILELDTGPPGGGSFAESVLQRSLLAHAPPALA